MKIREESNLKGLGAYDEYRKWTRFKTIGTALAGLVTVATLFLLVPLQALVVESLAPVTSPLDPGVHLLLGAHPAEVGGSAFALRLDFVAGYFESILQMLTGRLRPIDFLAFYHLPWLKAAFLDGQFVPTVGWALWITLALVLFLGVRQLNPHRKTPNIYGDTRYASEKDIAEMEKRDLVGFAKDLFVVGRFKLKNGKSKLLRMGETLSVLLLAPPGTGKSVGFIVPSIVTMDHVSMFIHDQKPELWDMTSAHRSRLGPCFQLKWTAEDAPDGRWLSEEEEKLTNPSLLARDEKGEVVRNPLSGEAKTKPLYYPSWNPLSPGSIPGPGPRRDMYIERLVGVLLEDPGGNSDKFWTSKARVALIGLIQFLVHKVEAASDPALGGTWKGLPQEWVGREASLPMLVDWFAWAQSEYDDHSEDPLRAMFRAFIDEAQDLATKYAADRRYKGVRPLGRAIVELSNLMSVPDKTRGSILTTMDDGLAPFKNEAVRQRTAVSDFAFNDLRGTPKAEARAREEEKMREAEAQGIDYKPRYAKDEWDPVSIYISVNLEDARTMAKITGVFVDAVNAYLVANGPSSIDDHKNQLGPYPFVFMLDEAPQLPKLDTVVNGPAVGRSKKISYIIVGQDYGQFEQKYSKPQVETLKSTTAIKVVLSQNNETTAKVVSDSAGKVTFESHSYSDKGNKAPLKLTGMFGEMFETNKKGESSSWQNTEFLKAAALMSLPQDKHLVLVQNYMNRPILCSTPKFFTDKEISPRVYNLRAFTGPPPAPPMNAALMERAAQRGKSEQERQAEADAERQLIEDPRCVVVATPADTQALARDEMGNKGKKGDLFAFCEVLLHPDDRFVDAPPPDAIEVTNDPARILEFAAGNRIVLFDENLLRAEINEPLERNGSNRRLKDSQLISLARRAQGIQDDPGEDIYHLGYRGGAALDLPEAPERVTPEYTLGWMIGVLSYILGIEEHQRTYEDDAA